MVLEALKERQSLSELAQKYDIHTNQISTWKREFLEGAEEIFTKGKKPVKSESEQEKGRLLKTICQLKIEVDFLPDRVIQASLKDALR